MTASLRPLVHNAEETAAIIGGDMTASWLKEQARKRAIPFTLLAARYSWTDAQIAEIIASGEHRPQPRHTATPPMRKAKQAPAPAASGVTVLQAKTPRRLQRQAPAA